MGTLLERIATAPILLALASCNITIPPPAPPIAPRTTINGNTHHPVGIIKCGVSKKHGFVVSDRRVVMTIGHFLPSFPKVDSEEVCQFIVAGYDQKPFRTGVTLHASALDEKKLLEDDWAVLVTDEPVPTDPMEIGKYSEVESIRDLRILYYSSYWNSHYVYSPRPCDIFKNPDLRSTFRYECGGRMANKGAPLVVFDGERNVVVGLTVRHNRSGVGLTGKPVRAINSAIRSLKTQPWRY